jgi:hypothetical protein
LCQQALRLSGPTLTLPPELLVTTAQRSVSACGVD